MKTDAELVALLLAEARAKRAYYASNPDTATEAKAFSAYTKSTIRLQAAVLERLEGEGR